jgi:hypothetical protein
MSRDELREAIVKPAGTVTFEGGLVDTLLDEVTSRPGSLPLLQFALREMWGLQRGQCITRRTYDAIGGVQGALARRAQTIFDTQTKTGLDDHAVGLFQRLFLRMVTLGEGAQDTRRVVGRQELVRRLGHSHSASLTRITASLLRMRPSPLRINKRAR